MLSEPHNHRVHRSHNFFGWMDWMKLDVISNIDLCSSSFSLKDKLWCDELWFGINLCKNSQPFPWQHMVFFSKCFFTFEVKGFLSWTFMVVQWHLVPVNDEGDPLHTSQWNSAVCSRHFSNSPEVAQLNPLSWWSISCLASINLCHIPSPHFSPLISKFQSFGLRSWVFTQQFIM